MYEKEKGTMECREIKVNRGSDYTEVAGELLAKQIRENCKVDRTARHIDSTSFFLVAIAREALEKGNLEEGKEIVNEVTVYFDNFGTKRYRVKVSFFQELE